MTIASSTEISLPVDILNRIFKYSDIPKLAVIYLRKYLYLDTIKHILKNKNITLPTDVKSITVHTDDVLYNITSNKLIKNPEQYKIIAKDYIKDLITTEYHDILNKVIIRSFPTKCNWQIISGQDGLTNEFIMAFHDKLDWKILQDNYILSDEIIMKFPDKINWNKIKKLYNVTDMIIKEICKLDWSNPEYYMVEQKDRYMYSYSRHSNIDFGNSSKLYKDLYTIILNYTEKQNWEQNNGISVDKYTISDLVNNMIDTKLNMNKNESTKLYETLTAAEVKKLLTYYDTDDEYENDDNDENSMYNFDSWCTILKSKIRTVEFIRQFKERLNWSFISFYNDMTDDFVREFADYINWYKINHTKLTTKFIKEFRDQIKWHEDSLCCLDESIIMELTDLIDMSKVNYCKYREMYSDEFLTEYTGVLNWDSIMYRGYAEHCQVYYLKKYNREHGLENDCRCDFDCLCFNKLSKKDCRCYKRCICNDIKNNQSIYDSEEDRYDNMHSNYKKSYIKKSGYGSGYEYGYGYGYSDSESESDSKLNIIYDDIDSNSSIKFPKIKKKYTILQTFNLERFISKIYKTKETSDDSSDDSSDNSSSFA